MLPLFLLLFFGPVTQGQEYPYIHYTPKDGLVNSRIRDIYQDSKGRLFLMTANGLSIYDGARFNNYTTEKDFSDPIINDVIEVGPDSLLVASNTSKLNAWVRGKVVEIKTEDNYCPVINKFLKATNGLIYAATDQGLYSLQGTRFTHLQIPDTVYKVTGLAFDDIQQAGDRLFLKGSVDITSPGGMYVFNLSTNKLDTFINHPFHSIVQFPGKNQLVCFTVNKIFAFNLQEAKSGKLKPIPVAATFQPIASTFSNKITLDKDQNLWCSHFNSILRIDEKGNQFLLDKTSGLDVNNITGVFVDKEKVLWIMTDGSGLIKLANSNVEIVTGLFGKSASGISAIYAQESSDTTWLFNFHDHIIYGASPKGIFHYQIDKNLMASNIFPQKDGFYLTDDWGIHFARFINQSKTRLKIYDIYKDTAKMNFPKAIMDQHGFIYVPGIQLAVIKDGKLKFMEKLPSFADQLCIDRHDQLWVITRGGDLISYIIDRNDGETILRLKHNFRTVIPFLRPRSVVIDSMDNVWVGTRYEGLYCFRFKDTSLVWQKHFTTKDGLTDNFIVTLNKSGTKTVWAGTQSGLDKISIKNGNFSVEGITRSNNVFEFVHSLSVSGDHKIWVRGASGSTMRINDEIDNSIKEFKPVLQITSIKTPDTSFNLPSDYLAFPYNQNNISFEAAAPTFIDEKQVLFSYQLEGSSNNKWSIPSTQASFNFINLRPGEYKLNVKAIFPVREYDSQQLSYHFTIQPPWWQTVWFRILSGVVAIVLLLLLMRAYVQRKLQLQRMAMEKQQAIEKERTRIASDMHDDLGAGLSTIRFLGEKINRNTIPPTNKTDIEKIVTNSNELVQKMNEIIWAMNEKNDSLEDLLFYTRSYAVGYCEENDLECHVHLPELVPHRFVSGEVRRNVFLMVKESLHNVVKHSGATQVGIEFQIDENLQVSIKDNGTGVKKLPYYSGGNGLLNMKKRIQVLGGSINVKNGSGFTIEFEVPLH